MPQPGGVAGREHLYSVVVFQNLGERDGVHGFTIAQAAGMQGGRTAETAETALALFAEVPLAGVTVAENGVGARRMQNFPCPTPGNRRKSRFCAAEVGQSS